MAGGEQVVPSWAPTTSTTKTQPSIISKPKGSIHKPKTESKLRRVSTIKTGLPKLASDISFDAISPALEYAGKMRWRTPTRIGNWSEPWCGAREMALSHCVRTAKAPALGLAIRQLIAEAVATHVGVQLPTVTVEKWLCLLSEYLELNSDEQVLVVCHLRRYIAAGGKFVGKGDWARPQRWECVVAVACYLSVLLTEEFPGRTAMDLKELLGANFKFGREQISFLKTVNWEVATHSEQFVEVKKVCEGLVKGDEKAKETARDWFKMDQALDEMKQRAENEASAAAAMAAAQAAALAAQSPTMTMQPIAKKRSFATIAPATDSVVPRVVIPRMDIPHVVPTTFIPAVPHWAPGW